MVNSIISGSGHFLPERVVPNEVFRSARFFDAEGEPMPMANEQIIRKFEEITEIRERLYTRDGVMNSDLATAAAQRALQDAELEKEALDYVIAAHNFGDITPEKKQIDIMPSLAARVKNKLSIANPRCIPYDMTFGCPGWLEGLILAHHFIQGGVARHILVVGSETLSRAVDPHDRNRMIFADGAGAVILSACEDIQKTGVLSHVTISENLAELDYLKNGRSLNPDYEESEVLIRMNGRRVYEYALKRVPSLIKEAVESAGLRPRELSKVLMHQANAKMDQAILERLVRLFDLPEAPEHFMPMTIQHFGNSSVATIPTLYDRIAKRQMEPHSFRVGDNLVFASVGAGMNVNAMVYRVTR